MIVNAFSSVCLVWMLSVSVLVCTLPTPGWVGLSLSEKVDRALDALMHQKEEIYLPEISRIITLLHEEIGDGKSENSIHPSFLRKTKSNGTRTTAENGDNYSPSESKTDPSALVRKLAIIVGATGDGEFGNGSLNSPNHETGANMKPNGTAEEVGTEEEVKVDYDAMGCGTKNKQLVQGRILGGSVASNGEWPWQVALIRVSTRKVFCGASLVNSRFLITAAHCVFRLRPRNLQAWLGSHVLTRHHEEHRMVRGISHKIVHKDYNRLNLRNDIALLRMDESVEFSRNIRPVCMPNAQDWDESFLEGSDDRIGMVAGWGITEERGNRSPVLLHIKVPFLNVSQCQEIYQRINTVTDKMLCTLDKFDNATNSSPRDSCKGDSGGPFVVVGDEGRWTQVGVVSFGYGCGRQGYPAVYTRVTKYLLWIYLKILQTEVAIVS